MRVVHLITSMGLAAAAVTTAGQTTGVAPLTPASLRTEGLNFGDDLARIYVGDFAQVGFARDGAEFAMLLSQYMNTYSRQCPNDLPANKVEIMVQECTRESYTVNGYGVEQAGSRHCVSYRTVGTGRYADPDVYRLHGQLEGALSRAMMGGVLGGVLGGARPGSDPTAGMRRMTDVAVYARNDLPMLLRQNQCSSPALKRLQDNMVLFGQGQQPIVLPGAAAALAAQGAAEGPRQNQNFQRLVDELITEQSQAWMMNRYQPGSVRASSALRDAQGRPREVQASYSFLSMGKPYAGKVRLTFAEGLPQCLYFSDVPQACRVPSPRIISAYRKNQYATDSGAETGMRATATNVPAVTPGPPTANLPAPGLAAAAAPAVAPLPPASPTPALAPALTPAMAEAPASTPTASAAAVDPATASREAAHQARLAAQQEQRAAALQRYCTALRANIDRAREMAASAAAQSAQRDETRLARAEAIYTQQCGR